MRTSIGLVVVVASARIAAAESNDIIGRPLVLDRGQVDVELVAAANAVPGDIAEPLSLSPDAWIGVTSRLTLGIVHSDLSIDRITTGTSFCVREVYPCDGRYHNVGADALWSVVAGPLAIAPRVRVLERAFTPDKLAVTLGAKVEWQRGRFAMIGDPYVQVGVDNRDLGNRNALVLPITFALQPTCRWMFTLDTGWNAYLAVWRDGWRVPINAGVHARATMHLDVGAALGFTSLLGPQNTPREREAFITLGWRT